MRSQHQLNPHCTHAEGRSYANLQLGMCSEAIMMPQPVWLALAAAFLKGDAMFGIAPGPQ